jgi:hypothetical protein
MKHFGDEPPQSKEPDFDGLHVQSVARSVDDESQIFAEEVRGVAPLLKLWTGRADGLACAGGAVIAVLPRMGTCRSVILLAMDVI